MSKKGMVGYKSIIYEREPPIARITLNRPEKLNALNGIGSDLGMEMVPGTIMAELAQAGDDIDKDPQIKVAIIKGNGRAFTSGFDISGEGEKTGGPMEWAQMEAGISRVFLRYIWENRKPFIAQVHGFCLAGGMDLVGVCDIAVCSEDAVFGYPAVRYGSIPTCSVWPFLIGYKKFKEIVYTGRHITAKEMYEFGMVNKVVPRDQLEEEVDLMAKTIAMVPETSIYFGKVYTNHVAEMMGLRTLLALMNASGGSIHAQPGEKQEFSKLVQEKGLKEALRIRDAKFVEVDEASEALRTRKLRK